MEQTKYIRLAADLQTDSIVDGPGLRAVLWTQGCNHHCKGCQNPQTWDFNGGGLVPIDMVKEAIDELEYQDGITFSGGDPMYQVEACNIIADYAIKKGLNIWVYTGFTYEEILELSKKNKIYKEFLSKIDVLVDGRFILKERDLSLLFRGSKNQRLIDMKKTLKEGNIVLFDEEEYSEINKFKREKTYV
ncbi:MAG: anaerobic ribonucleoside-triphosphate reductase activating protein [Bacilli bacterium]|nr:anaerobic ribonucleoside-triphosphate reductase activating protein [Bacilli bacterium]MBQ6282934.1 anaerobic ribonucleoside-triphosphate reductase activating protein [Bacilli bacterium]